MAVAAAMLATGCNNKKEEELRQQQALNEATRDELAAAVSDRDQLLGLVNEISSGMEQIKQLENILAIDGQSETPGQRQQIRSDIAAIQQTSSSADSNSKSLRRNCRTHLWQIPT